MLLLALPNVSTYRWYRLSKNKVFLLEEQQLMGVIGVSISIIQVSDVTKMQSVPTVRNAAPDPMFVHTSPPSHIWKMKQVHSSVI